MVHISALLSASIRHWVSNQHFLEAGNPRSVSCDASDCALCKVFFSNFACFGCPVYTRTKKHLCRDTPYREAVDAIDNFSLARFGDQLGVWPNISQKEQADCLARLQSAAIEAVKEEIRFLESLLEEAVESTVEPPHD